METHFFNFHSTEKKNQFTQFILYFHILEQKEGKFVIIIFRTSYSELWKCKREQVKSDWVTQKWKTCLCLLLSWQSHCLCECQGKLNNIHLDAIQGFISHDYNELNADKIHSIKVLNQNKTMRKQARKLDDLNMNNSITKQTIFSNTARGK